MPLLLIPTLSFAHFVFSLHASCSLPLLPSPKYLPLSNTMPLPEPVQEKLPDFGTHLDYHPLFHALVAHGHDQDEAMLLLLELWHRNTANNRPQQQLAQQPAVPPQLQLPHNEVQQPGHNKPELPGHPIHP